MVVVSENAILKSKDIAGQKRQMLNSDLIIRRAAAKDIEDAAKVDELAFPRQTFSKDWLDCVFKSFPKSQLFVAERAGEIIGLVFWTEKIGFRKEAVVELEQIAVHPDYQGRGIGIYLIIRSVILVAEKIAERGAKLCHILGNTRVNNNALKLYKTLGAQPIGKISGLFSADEVFLSINNVDIDQLLKMDEQSYSTETTIPLMVRRGIKNYKKIEK
jgi:ribosomal protein S18 acetylase RimI-like enzyme